MADATPPSTSGSLTAPAATPAVTPPAAGAAPAADPGSWMTGLNEDLKGYATTKGFKDPQSVLESYRNYEKLQGVPQDRLLKLPESMEAPEMRAIWERLGAPKDSKGYSLEVPKENGDPKLAETFSGIFHELGMPKNMGEKLVSKWNEYNAAQFKAMSDERSAKFSQENNELKAKWGAAYEQNSELAKQGMKLAGFTPQEVDALSATKGHKRTMEILSDLGKYLREDGVVNGGMSHPQLNTPEVANAEIQKLMSDTSFLQKLESGDVETRAKWDRLCKQASPGMMSI